MGVIKGSLISVSENNNKKVEDLNIKDDILSLKKENGLLNYKYSKKSLTLTHTENDYIYSNSYVHYQWNFKVNRYYVINGKLSITLDHIIYVQRDNINTWQNVKSLEIGDKLLKQDLSFEEIIKIDEIFEDIEVYSINLRGYYNYFCDGYLLHNSGICDQDLSFNLSSSNTSVSLPAGSCAYCGIENKFLWYGPHRYDGNNLATIPPVKYVGITEYGGDEYGAYRTYLTMPRPWYNWSKLRITSVVSGQYYHIYLHKDGNWKTHTASSNSITDRPPLSDIYPHDFSGIFNDGSGGVDTDFSLLGSYHAFCQGTLWVNFGTEDSGWVAYGLTSGTGLGGSSSSSGSGVNRTGENTTGGSTLSNWQSARLCFTVLKTSSNTRTDTLSINGTTTQSYSHAVARFRFTNIKGFELGNSHPRSTDTSKGGYNHGNTGDDYTWGASWTEISLKMAP